MTVSVQSRSRRFSEEAFGNFVILLFLVAQLLDGVFTYLGVAAFGLTEGNPIIAYYMKHHGVGPSVTLAKVLAVVCSMVLHILGLHRTLGVLTLLYLSLAVLPWTYLLFIAG